MLKLRKYSPCNAADSPCFHCDISFLCTKSLNNNGRIKQEILNQINNRSILSTDKQQIMDVLSFAIKCKMQYPNCQVKNEIETQHTATQHVLVDRGGNEILRANSFWGLIGEIIVTTIFAIIGISIIAIVVCGIANLFK